MQPRRLAARWLMPVEGPPISRGAILIGQDGRLQAVGPDAEVPRPPGVPTDDLAQAVILPGLVNTHTHLELTGFPRIEEPDFPSWIRRLRELKATRTPADYAGAARQGLADCYAAGVTTIADTGDSGAVIHALVEGGGSGIVYEEVFGPHPDQAEESLAGLQCRVAELRPLSSGRVRLGVSPHAPYTVSGLLFHAVARWARAEGLPWAVHIAESRAETQLLAANAGPFADAWRARGIPLPSPPGRSPVQLLAEHEVLSSQCLCIHAVQVGPDDIARLRAADAAVAHCPLSNEAHRQGEAPLAAFLRAGIRLGLGTDSVASVGRLDLLAEARAARRLASLDAEQTVWLCTLSGAQALGVEAEIGSLVLGKWADCVAIHVASGEGNPYEQVLGSSVSDVALTLVGGREVYRNG